MSEPTDHELLADYARTGDGAVFARLVARHINLVHSAARRYAGNDHLAEEITQAVFLILTRKAGSLANGGPRRHVALAGWLYQTARLTAANALKADLRRQRREQEAYMQSQENETDAAVWREIAPLLDDAMGKLGETDRTVLVLRFFERQTNAQVAAALGLAEGAVQKRTLRALEKLRKFFAKRGVTLTAALIASAVGTNSVQAAPVALVKTVSAVAAAKGVAAGASTLALVKGVLNLMAWAKAKTTALIGTGLLVSCGLIYYSWQVPEANSVVLSDTTPQVKIVPTRYPDGFGSGLGVNDKSLGISLPLKLIIQRAYGQVNDLKMVISTKLPDGKYDYIANLPSGSENALQQEISRQFGIVGRFESQTKDVLLLKLNNATALKLVPRKHGWDKAGNWKEGHLWRWSGQSSHTLADSLAQFFKIPIVDQTELTNLQNFTFDINWDFTSRDPEKMKQSLNEIGLGLVPTNQLIEMLVIEKVK